MTRFRSLPFVFAALIAASTIVLAQSEPKFDVYDRGVYRSEVPRPQSILRYDVGDHHTTYAQMERVIESIAKAAPDRVRIFEIGQTNEYRMQYVIAISSPKNIARLNEIRALNAKLTNPKSTSPAEAKKIIDDIPAVAWMAYTIHGNESASFETMMQVVYQLAASNEKTTLDILDNTVVLVVAGEKDDVAGDVETLVAAIPAFADLTLDFDIEAAGEKYQTRLWVSGERIRFDAAQGSTIVLPDQNRLLMLFHGTRTFTSIPQDDPLGGRPGSESAETGADRRAGSPV